MCILIILGSKSDMPVAEKVTDVLNTHSTAYDLEIASAHREPEKVLKLIKKKDYKVYICIAGLSAALPGFVASHTDRPVIGVPVSAKMGGLDALLSIAQMPKGVPVACVGIDNGQNAAHLALRILSIR
jgi:5-(carboxyamino)imidazole ribonucleotide mutase